MLDKVFSRIKVAPLTEKVATRDGCIYMYFVMKIIGWIPPKEGLRRKLYRLWTFTTFVFGGVYLPMGLALSYTLEFNNFTPDEFLTSLQVGLNSVGAPIKSFIVFINLWRLRKTEDILDELDKRVQGDAERQKVHERVSFTNYVFLGFNIVYNMYAFSTYLSYVLSGRPPWSVYNPFLDWRKNWISLWTEATFEYIIMTFAVTQDLIADTYLVVFILLIRGHFDLLKKRVFNLRTDPNKTEEENYEDLVNCIRDHKKIIEWVVELILFNCILKYSVPTNRCCTNIRPMISGTIFVQFALIGSVLGLTLINIFFFSDIWRGLASFVFVIAVLMETFPFCYNCNLLMDDSDELANELFHSNWVGAEPRYKQTLIHFMHQAQQYILFIAGGIIPINMSSNFTVAKFAFSIITIVREMNLAEQFQ
ncbi:hypothetical protein KR222_007771 [Zaprionus bogoriensis]|nr:hypothetical protein KR222_007771 [Zaprionus bogoriensis]